MRRLLVALICALFHVTPALAQTPVIACAADLKFALEEIASHFQHDTNHEIKLVFGSSGNFYRQILQGAPFQMFMSADEDFVFKLAQAGQTLDRGDLYALGRIGIFVPQGSPLKPDGGLTDLAAALTDGRLRRFAIANPEHAPYGRRAEEALKHAGLWERIKSKLVLGENVSQAAQFATSDSAQGGIIAYSLARAPAVARLGQFALISDAWHEPLKQRMVLLKNAGNTAKEFYKYMRQPSARAIMRRYGFTLHATQ